MSGADPLLDAVLALVHDGKAPDQASDGDGEAAGDGAEASGARALLLRPLLRVARRVNPF